MSKSHIIKSKSSNSLSHIPRIGKIQHGFKSQFMRKKTQIVLKFYLHDLVETRLRTFLEFTFVHIYHLCTKKYYVCSHLEINVCTHSLLKTSLFVSLLLMYIIFSSWLENTSYWSSASLVSSLDFGNFGCVFSPSPVYALSDRFNIAWQKICCVLLCNFCHNNLVWSFSRFIRGLTFGLLTNFICLWINLSSGSEWLCSHDRLTPLSHWDQ